MKNNIIHIKDKKLAKRLKEFLSSPIKYVVEPHEPVWEINIAACGTVYDIKERLTNFITNK